MNNKTKYILVGVYEKEEKLNSAQCIDILYYNDNKEAYDDMSDYIWKHHKDNLNKYDLLFLISNKVEIIGRASNFTAIDYLQMQLEQTDDFQDYDPVYVDIPEWDERVLLSNLLKVDLMNGKLEQETNEIEQVKLLISNDEYEMKNDWLFLDNHNDRTVYCPFCGKDLKDNIFTTDGVGGAMEGGAHCDDCNIDVYTYKIVDCK